MATASDAKGNLPHWVQRRGVPGAIAKDVGLFMKWTAGRRRPSVERAAAAAPVFSTST